MQLECLLAGLPHTLAVAGSTAVPVTGIVSDSRQVTPGALFVAYRGVDADGHRFIPAAVERGAAAVIGERPDPGLPVPYVQVADGRKALGWLVAAWHGHPSRTMALVGITGTDGKTTTANLLYSILSAAGRRAGLISTVHAVIGSAILDTGLHTTTPDAPDVQRYLAQMHEAGSEVAVLEVTSHGLAQQRVAGCAFDVAVVTNITHEHLDFHGSYREYRDAKAMLFRGLLASEKKPGFAELRKTAVLNRDDSSYDYLAAIPVECVMTYGTQPPAPDLPGLHLTATAIRHSPAGSQFTIQTTDGERKRAPEEAAVRTTLIGDFNVSNILAASAAGLALGASWDSIRAGIEAVTGVPGRMERIQAGQDFTAIVDFAHTPNALERALVTVRGLVSAGGRVITVFGCAGLRDREKRRLMGEVAARTADYTVITAEDPRTEDLTMIMAETAAACSALGRIEGRDFARVADRQQALLHAVERARPGDVVIACGKGHELSMCFGSTEYPWRDQDALRWALEARQGRSGAMPPFVLPTWHAR